MSASDKEAVRSRLARLLHEIGAIPIDQITDGATVDDELQMSSLAFLELQAALEDEYGIQIDPIRVVELGSFAAIVEHVHELASAAAAA